MTLQCAAQHLFLQHATCTEDHCRQSTNTAALFVQHTAPLPLVFCKHWCDCLCCLALVMCNPCEKIGVVCLVSLELATVHSFVLIALRCIALHCVHTCMHVCVCVHVCAHVHVAVLHCCTAILIDCNTTGDTDHAQCP